MHDIVLGASMNEAIKSVYALAEKAVLLRSGCKYFQCVENPVDFFV